MDALAYDTEGAPEREGAAIEHEGRLPPQANATDAVQRLAERRAELWAQLQTVDQRGDEEMARPRFSNHLAEDAQDQQQRQSEAMMRRMMQHDLRQVEHALERAAGGNYGLCEECGGEIPLRRLQAVPAATLCVRCQARREARGTG